MLQHGSGPAHLYGFLIGVEIQAGSPTTPEIVTRLLSEWLQYMSGIGKAEVESLGEIPVYAGTEAEVESLGKIPVYDNRWPRPRVGAE
jgi:hypothetical protein